MSFITIALQALKWLVKNPLVIVIAVLGTANLIQTFTIVSKNVEIANLNLDVDKLENENTKLKSTIYTANTKIAEQNAAILIRVAKTKELEDKLALAKIANSELDQKVQDLLNSETEAPQDSKGALNWLREKALEIKSWEKQL
jgi:hypothetical protein